MKNFFRMMLFAAAILCSAGVFAQKASELKYYDVRELGLPVVGKPFEDCVRVNDTISDGYFTRLPADLQNVARKSLWDLAQNSAGMAIRFRSNAKCIGAAWKPLNNFGMSHMTPTGVRGLDLYTLEDGEWLFVGAGQPNGKNSKNIFRRAMNGEMREYIMYLPLYDGIVDLAIGVDSAAVVEKPHVADLVPSKDRLPIVFYGTSVTQGGCATRPGMAFPAIMERKMHRETIKLGFSGNGRMDKCVGEKIAQIPASMYVIDCLSNCTIDMVRDSTEHFVRAIAQANPDVPIILLSNYCYPYQYLDEQFQKDTEEENALWKEWAEKFRKEGYKNVRYLDAYANGNMKKSPIGPDHEGTVDGGHMTDLGFLRFADFLIKKLKF